MQISDDTRFDWLKDGDGSDKMVFWSEVSVRSRFQNDLLQLAKSNGARAALAKQIYFARSGIFKPSPVVGGFPKDFAGLIWLVTKVDFRITAQGNLQIEFTTMSDGNPITLIWAHKSATDPPFFSHYGPIEGRRSKGGDPQKMRCSLGFDQLVRTIFTYESLDRVKQKYDDMEVDILTFTQILFSPGEVNDQTSTRLIAEMSEAKKTARSASTKKPDFPCGDDEENEDDEDEDDEDDEDDEEHDEHKLKQKTTSNTTTPKQAKPTNRKAPKNADEDKNSKTPTPKQRPTAPTQSAKGHKEKQSEGDDGDEDDDDDEDDGEHIHTQKTTSNTTTPKQTTPTNRKAPKNADAHKNLTTPTPKNRTAATKQNVKKKSAKKQSPAGEDSENSSDTDGDGSTSTSSSSSTEDVNESEGRKSSSALVLRMSPNPKEELNSTAMTVVAVPKQELQATEDAEIHGDSLAANQRSAVNKLCRVMFLTDGTVLKKHPAIPMAKDKVRAMSISEGQRYLDDAHVSEIVTKILQNPNTTVNSLSILNLNFDMTTFELQSIGLALLFDGPCSYGALGGNHYIAALRRVLLQQRAYFDQNKELHYKDGEVFALGNLKNLLHGEYSNVCLHLPAYVDIHRPNFPAIASILTPHLQALVNIHFI